MTKSWPRRIWDALRGRGPGGLQRTLLPPEAELIDGINEIDLAPGEFPGMITRFGYCRRCKMVYPPEWDHGCEGNVTWAKGQPVDRDGL